MDTKVTKFFISTLLLSAGIIVGVEAQSAGTVHGLDGSSYDPTTGSPPYGLYCNADSGPPPAQLDGLVAAYGNHGSGECNLYATDGQALEYSPDNSTAPSIVCGLTYHVSPEAPNADVFVCASLPRTPTVKGAKLFDTMNIDCQTIVGALHSLQDNCRSSDGSHLGGVAQIPDRNPQVSDSTGGGSEESPTTGTIAPWIVIQSS